MRIGVRVGPVWVSGGSRGRRRRSSGSGEGDPVAFFKGCVYFFAGCAALFAMLKFGGLITALSFLVVTYFFDSPPPTLLASEGGGRAVLTKIYDLMCGVLPGFPTPLRTFQKLSLLAAATWALITQLLLRSEAQKLSSCLATPVKKGFGGASLQATKSDCPDGLLWVRGTNMQYVVGAGLVVIGLGLIVVRHRRKDGASISADVACSSSD